MASPVKLDFDDVAGGRAGTHVRPETLRIYAAPSTSPASVPFNTIEPGLRTVACWRMDDVRFEFDSSFILPVARKEIALLHAIVDEHAGNPLSVFGHADPSGTDEYNKGLSGRRAQSIFAMLVRDVDLWEELWTHPVGGDSWGALSIRSMLEALPCDATGEPYMAAAPGPGAASTNAIRLFQQEHALAVDGDAGPNTRRALFRAYMDFLCDGEALHLQPDDFLGGGANSGGKGDYQGCSEFNPVLVFSRADAASLDQPARHAERNTRNSPNRRVVIFFFPAGTRVEDASWPCPRVRENASACRSRFWSDGEARRRPLASERRYEDTRDTFACRFYDRMALRSPCEASTETTSFSVRLCDFDKDPIGGAPFRVSQGTAVRSGFTEPDGSATILALKQPDKLRIDWTRPELANDFEFPFTREYFVEVGNDAGSDDRRLFNLGYVKPDQNANVRDYQRDFGQPVTGKLADIAAELRAFHDGGPRPPGRRK
jgi:hypothetical protein